MLIVVGLHVPVTGGLLPELMGNTGGIEFMHKGPIRGKVGTISVTISIFIVVVEAHFPLEGVKT